DVLGAAPPLEAEGATNEPAAPTTGRETLCWSDWAVGIAEKGAILFGRFGGTYREGRRLVVRKGRQMRLLQQFAREGGKLARADAVKEDLKCPRDRNPEEARALLKTIKVEIHHIRDSIKNAIRETIGAARVQVEIGDPLPWTGDGWTSKLLIGY